jgi:hypothetical protein
MSAEITLQAKLQSVKNNQTFTNQVWQKTQNMKTTLDMGHHTSQIVSTSKEILSTGDVTLTEEHFVLLYNRDASNFVDVFMRLNATPTDVQSGRMRPGESYGPVRLMLQTASYPSLWLQANTAACDVEVVVCDGGDPAA